jgi:Na+/H+ antiporter NhaB
MDNVVIRNQNNKHTTMERYKFNTLFQAIEKVVYTNELPLGVWMVDVQTALEAGFITSEQYKGLHTFTLNLLKK